MNNGKVVVGLIAGLAAGAMLGVLFAPDKGERTRRKIFRKGANTVEDAKDRVDEILDSLTDKLKSAKETVSEMMFEKSKSNAGELSRNSVKA